MVGKTGFAINPSEVFIQLSEGSILVSPEEPEEFSCRQLIAAWLELYYGLEICEVTILENGKMKTLPRNVYYQMCKSILEEMIKEDIDMNGYTSIAAAYAYERAKKVERRYYSRYCSFEYFLYKLSSNVTFKLELYSRNLIQSIKE